MDLMNNLLISKTRDIANICIYHRLKWDFEIKPYCNLEKLFGGKNISENAYVKGIEKHKFIANL